MIIIIIIIMIIIIIIIIIIIKTKKESLEERDSKSWTLHLGGDQSMELES